MKKSKSTEKVSAYGSLGLPQVCELDVLVRERDFSRTRDLRLARGCRPCK